jgi:aspartate dehydrogenase
VSASDSKAPLRVGLLGWGAIGAEVGRALMRGDIPGAELVAVAATHHHDDLDDLDVIQVTPLDLAAYADLVVEAAGHQALVEFGPALLASGADLLVVSVGALADDSLFDRLTTADGGRLMISTGAIGGIDMLSACRQLGRVDDVHLTTTKPSNVLVQPWMDDEMKRRLADGVGIVTCFSGPAREAVGLFPTSVNVAAALAVAAGSWESVRVDVIGDPAASRNTHVIDVSAESGDYRFEISNRPSPQNPRSSQVVPFAVLRALGVLAGRSGQFV